ncbi:N-acetylmuramoyl-L-alanine amidase, partial [Streptomyces sp. ETH9427]
MIVHPSNLFRRRLLLAGAAGLAAGALSGVAHARG